MKIETIPDWKEINIAHSFHDAIRMPFGEGKNLIIVPRTQEIEAADFKELTQALTEKHALTADDSLILRPNDVLAVRENLSEAGKKASDIVVSDISGLNSVLRKGDTLYLKLQGPQYTDTTQFPHRDSTDTVVVRYSGPKTVEYANGSVSKAFKYGNVVLTDNPEQFKLPHGAVCVQKGESIFDFKIDHHYPFLHKNHGAAHSKGIPNDEAGLLIFAELIR